MTLTDFLLARIAEDEASAINWLRFEVRDGIPGNYAIPDRIKAECEAKRRIVELHTAYPEPQVMVYGTIVACSECGSVDDSPVQWPCPTLRAIALPYLDHLLYHEEWRP